MEKDDGENVQRPAQSCPRYRRTGSSGAGRRSGTLPAPALRWTRSCHHSKGSALRPRPTTWRRRRTTHVHRARRRGGLTGQGPGSGEGASRGRGRRGSKAVAPTCPARFVTPRARESVSRAIGKSVNSISLRPPPQVSSACNVVCDELCGVHGGDGNGDNVDREEGMVSNIGRRRAWCGTASSFAPARLTPTTKGPLHLSCHDSVKLSTSHTSQTLLMYSQV